MAWRRRVARGALRTGALLLACVVAGAALNIDRLSSVASRQWQDIRAGADPESGRSRLMGLQPYQRPDYWQVSLDAVIERPVLGLGAGNFEQRYTAEKSLGKHSRYPHNLWLRVASENGIVGIVLLSVLIGAIVVGLLRLRAGGAGKAALVAALAGVCGYFAFHASLDWIEEYPVLAGPVLAIALAALSTTDTPAAARRSGDPAPWRKAGAAAVVCVAIVGLISLSAPFMAAHQLETAQEAVSSDPTDVLPAIHRAAALNPLDPTPALLEGFLAVQTRDWNRARAAFERSLAVEDGWLAHFELALLDAARGRFAAAARSLERADRRNNADPLIDYARDQIADRVRVDPREVNAMVLQAPLYSR